MKNDIKILETLLKKLQQTPDNIIESAIDKLSEKIIIEKYIYNSYIHYKNESLNNNFDIERENKKWRNENLQLVA